MLTVPEATEKIIKRSRYLNEAISKKIINISSLARYIRPELEEMLNKKVSHAAIVMSLKRLSRNIKPNYVPMDKIFKSAPEMIVRSNLVEIVIVNSHTIDEACASVLKIAKTQPKYFCSISKASFYTTFIMSEDMYEIAKVKIETEPIIEEFKKISSISIQLPEESYEFPGIFYFFLKSLAWEGVNIIDVISTYLEFNIIIQGKDTNRTFSILQSLFNKS